jgi:hypothetical protein
VTVTASRPLPSVQPDQAVVSAYVNSPAGSTLDDVLAALGPVFSAANLSNSFSDGSFNQWTFTLTVTVARLGSILAAANPPTVASRIQVNYSLYAQASPQLQASQQCPYSLLVADAQVQAQRLAAAAGASVGPILSVSDGSAQGGGVLTGVFLAVVPANRFFDPLAGYTPPPPTCSMTVQFSLH